MASTDNANRNAVPAQPATAGGLRIVSWNLLRLVGAGVTDVAALIESYRPDLLLMQEATSELSALPSIVGGHYFREPMDRRVYGLAAWSPGEFARPLPLPLPVSPMPGGLPPRLAQIVKLGSLSIANVHLSHGQFLNRWQLLHIARALEGPAAIIGDYNAVGPIRLPGFADAGPRHPTHLAGNIISCRLDRCMVRDLRCTDTRVLARGPSDHHPILLHLDAAAATAPVRTSALRQRSLHAVRRLRSAR
jgi:endonuclease/exonuclease/phosphatase family metal-dependent hydrolase